MSFGQRPQRMRISSAVAALLGLLRPRAAMPTREWEPGRHSRGWAPSGGGSQRMRVSRHLSRPVDEKRTYMGLPRMRSNRNHRGRYG